MITFRSLRRGKSCLRYPMMKSIFSERSCASSIIMVSYLVRNRSLASSANKIPSVIKRTIESCEPCSLKRTLKEIDSPSFSPTSSAIRCDTLRAARRRGWVWPIRPVRPRPASMAICGNCVVLPEPVSPATIIT